MYGVIRLEPQRSEPFRCELPLGADGGHEGPFAAIVDHRDVETRVRIRDGVECDPDSLARERAARKVTERSRAMSAAIHAG